MGKSLRIGEFELHWLNGGVFELDGGSMFGVVPRVLWAKKYPHDENNYIRLTNSPILIKTGHELILIESGLGNKLTGKQKQIFRVKEDWNILNDLAALGIQRGDINFVILTHYDFDHAGGVVMQEGDGQPALTFPNAKHILQKTEWDDALNPNKRSLNTYWPVNFEKLKESKNLELVDGKAEIVDGVNVLHTMGHTKGHQAVSIESQGAKALHMADLLPTHAHSNPLWIMAYDNFPLEAIDAKEKLLNSGIAGNVWFTFYHDAFMKACRFDQKGNVTERFE